MAVRQAQASSSRTPSRPRKLEDLVGRAAELGLVLPGGFEPEVESEQIGLGAQMVRDDDVVAHLMPLKIVVSWKVRTTPYARHDMRREARDALALEADLAGGRPQEGGRSA